MALTVDLAFSPMEQASTDQPAGAPIPPALLAIAQALVSRWEHELPTGVPRMPRVWRG